MVVSVGFCIFLAIVFVAFVVCEMAAAEKEIDELKDKVAILEADNDLLSNELKQAKKRNDMLSESVRFDFDDDE